MMVTEGQIYPRWEVEWAAYAGNGADSVVEDGDVVDNADEEGVEVEPML